MLTISLPTNATSGSSSCRRASAAPAWRGSRANALGAPAGWRSRTCARASASSASPALARGLLERAKARHVDPGRAQPGARRQPRVRDRLPQASGRVARAHEHRGGGREPLAGEAQEALRFGLDGVLEGAAVDLDRVGRARAERPREDHGPHHQVVCERQLRPRAGGDLDDGIDVRIQIAAQLAVAELGEGAGFDRLVAVGHVHRQQPADVGAVDGAAAGPSAGHRGPVRGRAQPAHLERPRVPVAGRVDEPQMLRVALLAEQVDLVPEARERLREARVVDVGAGPGQQVAVEDEDARHLLR